MTTTKILILIAMLVIVDFITGYVKDYHQC